MRRGASLLAAVEEEKPTFSGFQTGSGKKVSVSDEAMRRGASLLAAVEEEEPTFSGFQTGSGKKVSVSEEAMKKGASLVATVADEENAFPGFQTGSGKKVSVSEDAMRKGAALFADAEHAGSSSSFSGFQTGSGKKVSVSDEAIKKGATLLADSERELPTFSGFQTGSGRKVSVSEEAMKKGTALLQSDESDLMVTPLKTSNVMASPSLSADRSAHVVFPHRAIRHQPQNGRDNLAASSRRAPAKSTVGLHRSAPKRPSTAVRVPPSKSLHGLESPAYRPRRLNFTSPAISKKKRILSSPTSQTESSKKKEKLSRETLGPLMAEQALIFKAKRQKWTDVIGAKQPFRANRSDLIKFDLSPGVLDVTCKSAQSFKFSGINDEGTILTVGAIEMHSLMVKEGFDPKYCTEKWVSNHFRWIVWKLASMERSFPAEFGGKHCNAAHVMLQLKQRYYREFECAHRSCLKRILERDNSASHHMILFVATISQGGEEEGNKGVSLDLCDGWYSIQAFVDPALEKLIDRGRISVGTKLRIIGAELGGTQDGVSPLDAHCGFLKM